MVPVCCTERTGCLAAVWSCLRWKQVEEIVAKNRSFPPSSSPPPSGEIPANVGSKNRFGAASSSGSSGSRSSGGAILEWNGVSHWLTVPRNSRFGD